MKKIVSILSLLFLAGVASIRTFAQNCYDLTDTDKRKALLSEQYCTYDQGGWQKYANGSEGKPSTKCQLQLAGLDKDYIAQHPELDGKQKAYVMLHEAESLAWAGKIVQPIGVLNDILKDPKITGNGGMSADFIIYVKSIIDFLKDGKPSENNKNLQDMRKNLEQLRKAKFNCPDVPNCPGGQPIPPDRCGKPPSMWSNAVYFEISCFGESYFNVTANPNVPSCKKDALPGMPDHGPSQPAESAPPPATISK